MANLSDASGKIIFENFEKCPEFLKEIKGYITQYLSQEETQYFIEIYSDEEGNVSDDLEEEFYAIGRWTFANSLSNFFENLMRDLIDDVLIHEEYSEKVIKEKMEYINDTFKENDLSLRFEFTDYEPGMEILLDGLFEIKPNLIKDYGEDKEYHLETLVISEDFTDLEINAMNLIETLICDQENDFIFPEEINFVDKEILPEEDVLDIEVDEDHIEIRKELLKRYFEENEIYCNRENRMLQID